MSQHHKANPEHSLAQSFHRLEPHLHLYSPSDHQSPPGDVEGREGAEPARLVPGDAPPRRARACAGHKAGLERPGGR